MARGGKRPGAGRPKGAKNIGNRAIEALVGRKYGTTPRDFLIGVMNDDGVPLTVRIDAAGKAAPYVHPRLANVEHTGADGAPLAAVAQLELRLGGLGPDELGTLERALAGD